MATLQALLFDVDGTIADTEELHRQSFNHAFLRSNLKWEWTPAIYAELLAISGGLDRLAVYIDRLGVPADEKERLRRLIPHIHRTKTYEFGVRLEEGSLKPWPGVVRLIEKASAAGIKIGFASTSAWTNVSTLVAAVFGPSTRFEIGAIAGADMVARRKPAPDVYQLLLGMLRVPADACVAFEDSANGVAAARAAGIFVVATPSGWTAAQDFSCADLVLPTLGDPGAMLELDDAVAARLGGARWFSLCDADALHARTS